MSAQRQSGWPEELYSRIVRTWSPSTLYSHSLSHHYNSIHRYMHTEHSDWFSKDGKGTIFLEGIPGVGYMVAVAQAMDGNTVSYPRHRSLPTADISSGASEACRYKEHGLAYNDCCCCRRRACRWTRRSSVWGCRGEGGWDRFRKSDCRCCRPESKKRRWRADVDDRLHRGCDECRRGRCGECWTGLVPGDRRGDGICCEQVCKFFRGISNDVLR